MCTREREKERERERGRERWGGGGGGGGLKVHEKVMRKEGRVQETEREKIKREISEHRECTCMLYCMYSMTYIVILCPYMYMYMYMQYNVYVSGRVDTLN